MTERLPAPSSARIRDTAIAAADTIMLPAGERLVRIHPLSGPHPLAWNEFRAWGPTRSRFDHHTLPRRTQRRRVAYLTRGPTGFIAAIAEFFQDDNGGVLPLDVTFRKPSVCVIELESPLRLLNLDSGWVTRAGGNQAISTGSRKVSRDWARAIYRHHAVDGVAYSSSVWGPGRCVALWERAAAALPGAPSAQRTLDDPALVSAVGAAAQTLATSLL